MIDTTRRLLIGTENDRYGFSVVRTELLRTAAKEIQLLRGACLVACLAAGIAWAITLAVILW